MLELFKEFIKIIPNGLYYLAIACIVWKIAQFYFVRFRDCERRIADISDVKKDLNDKIEPTLVKINLTLDRIARYIVGRDALNHDYFSTGNPIELNEFAKEVLEKSGAKHFIDSSYDFLSLKIDELKPKSILDIQQLAISVLFDLIDTEGFSIIKDFIYQNPKYKGKKIDIPTMIIIMSLYLRDQYFEKHPEFRKTNLE